MHCNLRPPEPRQPFPALTTMPCQVWSHSTHPLPYYSVFAADTLLYTITLNFDPVTLTFDLWPWTFAAYRRWRDETLYQIWTQSSNSRRSYCNFGVWPYDLEHCVTCCARLWDNSHRVWPSTLYRVEFVSYCDRVECKTSLSNLCLHYWHLVTSGRCRP